MIFQHRNPARRQSSSRRRDADIAPYLGETSSLTRFMSHELCLEMLDLPLYPAADPMLDQIDLRGADAERLRHLQNRLFLDHVQVEHLVMPRVALPFHFLNGGVDQVLF